MRDLRIVRPLALRNRGATSQRRPHAGGNGVCAKAISATTPKEPSLNAGVASSGKTPDMHLGTGLAGMLCWRNRHTSNS